MQAPEPFALYLLPPLWSIVSDYFDPAERWYYADLKTFQIRHPGDSEAILNVVIMNGHLGIFVPPGNPSIRSVPAR